ncbi:hypothetical protein EI94DRAFT_1706490 [Lactarius quietus]|nr:hypothetical protein EI94DRAFT_1706490 [Lactarius quietus]
MSTNVQASTSTPNFQPIFDEALKQYKKKTGKDLTTHPLAEEINRCGSPDDILAVLQGKANALNQSQSVDQRLTKWLTPTVNVLNALSATVGQGLGMVFPPIQIICSGISILLVHYLTQAARDTAASRDTLIELFERIESFFIRLQTYTEGPPTAAMTNVMGKIMAEVLSMLAILTKEMKPRRTKTFLKKLIGRNDVEDALQRLEKLEQEELRTVNTHVFKTTSDIKDVASVLKETTSDIKETTNNIKATTSDIKATTSDIRETTSDIKETTSDIKGCELLVRLLVPLVPNSSD